MGFQTTGAASEYFAVDFEKIVPLSENMSYDEGAMIEPLAVAVHAVRKTGNIQGKNVIVMGAGPIGSLVSQYAKGLGTARIMIRGVSDIRLEKAKECGADSALNVGRSDPVSYTHLDVYKRQVLTQAYNTTMIVGIFRAGGDTKFGLFLDVATMWGGSILLGAVCAFVLHWSIPAVYVVLMCDEVIKVPFTTWRYKSMQWLRNVTR